MMEIRRLSHNLIGDIFGGLASMLVVFPSAIAFGIIIYSPLGSPYVGKAALAGMIGVVILGIAASAFGGTPRLITAPCANAAAVLSVFVAELVNGGLIPIDVIPFFVCLVAFLAGVVQFLSGRFGGGKFIKYIPYPVIAGYLSGIGILIFLAQLPKFLGLPRELSLMSGILQPGLWNGQSICIGSVTIFTMALAPRIFKLVPAVIIAVLSGIGVYFLLALFKPGLLSIENNPLIIGPVFSPGYEYVSSTINQWAHLSLVDINHFSMILIPFLTLAILLSFSTLKTCVILDVLTHTRHNSNKELMGQGLANMASAVAGGIPGSGVTGSTLVNVASGAKTRMSGVFTGIFAACAMMMLGEFIAWIPLAALAGVLIVVAGRMIDINSFQLLKHKSTLFDFMVIMAVVISAVSMSLIIAAGVGTAMAIAIFLREQIRFSVVRRKFFGNQKFSKKRRVTSELSILEARGGNTIICELQGQLFFGTTDQLFLELEPYLTRCSFVILDMRRVQSLDFTAANMLRQIYGQIEERGGYLLLTSVPLSLPTGQNIKEYLESLGFSERGMNLKFFPDMDSALEWVEDEILQRAADGQREVKEALMLSEFEFFSGFPAEALEAVTDLMTEKTFQPSETIFNMGDKSDEIYFIRKGEVKIILPLSGGMTHYLATFSRGDFFGELSFLDRGRRSAGAIAVDDVILFVLSRDQFEKINISYPELAGSFFEHLAYAISQRLRHTNIELMALQE